MRPPLIGRYEFLEALASGACGRIYVGRDSLSGIKCAIKHLHPDTDNGEARQLIKDRFEREGDILKTLSHRQIPKFYDFVEEDGEFYIVQEFIEGKTLAKKVEQEGPLSESEVIITLISLLNVLVYIQSRGIFHRDIKPDNVILRAGNDEPVLIDFGMIKEAFIALQKGQPIYPSVSVGAIGYKAPDEILSLATDIFSLGRTSVYLLTGQQPKHLISLVPEKFTWRNFAPKVSPEFVAVLEKAMQHKQEDRYKDASQMLEALHSLGRPTGRSEAAQAPSFESPDRHRIIIHLHPSTLESKTETEDSASKSDIKTDVGKPQDDTPSPAHPIPGLTKTGEPQPQSKYPTLKMFEFEVVTESRHGYEMARHKGKAQFFTEVIDEHRPSRGLRLVRVPGGSFLMEPAYDDPGDGRTVTVQPFFISTERITWQDWLMVRALPEVNRPLRFDPWLVKEGGEQIVAVGFSTET